MTISSVGVQGEFAGSVWYRSSRNSGPLRAAVAVLAVLALQLMGAAGARERYAAIVVDHKSGKVLYSRHADATRYPASLVKIMTLYMLFEQLEAGKLSLNTPLKASSRAARQTPSKVGLKPGETIRVKDAIKVLITKSANDVAVIVAETLAGSEARFAKAMTEKARALGMTGTVFQNASGLPNAKQVTTARDMALLARHMVEDFEDYYGYFSLQYFSYRGKRYKNHNGLLFSDKSVDGIKTGYIRSSGFNVAISARRDDKHLIAIVMGGKTAKARNAHAKVLLDRYFPKATTKRRWAKEPKKPPLPLRNPRRGARPVAAVRTAPPKAKPEPKPVKKVVAPPRKPRPKPKPPAPAVAAKPEPRPVPYPAAGVAAPQRKPSAAANVLPWTPGVPDAGAQRPQTPKVEQGSGEETAQP